jgi:hypothetical protein
MAKLSAQLIVIIAIVFLHCSRPGHGHSHVLSGDWTMDIMVVAVGMEAHVSTSSAVL